MNNWINRFAIFAVVGAILSSAVLVGCAGDAEEEAPANGAAMEKAPADGE